MPLPSGPLSGPSQTAVKRWGPGRDDETPEPPPTAVLPFAVPRLPLNTCAEARRSWQPPKEGEGIVTPHAPRTPPPPFCSRATRSDLNGNPREREKPPLGGCSSPNRIPWGPTRHVASRDRSWTRCPDQRLTFGASGWTESGRPSFARFPDTLYGPVHPQPIHPRDIRPAPPCAPSTHSGAQEGVGSVPVPSSLPPAVGRAKAPAGRNASTRPARHRVFVLG